MRKTKMTGRACVGDLRLTPIDVGFDLRLLGMEVILPAHFESVGLAGKNGETYLVEGTREEMVATIKKAGYRVAQESL